MRSSCFCILGATVGHAKNSSIHLLAGGGFRPTPLYDVISAWPIVGPKQSQLHEKKLKLAMALHGKNRHSHSRRFDAGISTLQPACVASAPT